MEYKRLILGTEYALSEVVEDHGRVMDKILSLRDSNWRYQRQFARTRTAEIYLERHCWAEAASLLCDAHEELEEYTSNHYTHNLVHPSPLSMMAIVWQLQLLGQAYAGQGEHDIALATLRLAVNTARDHLKPGHATRIRVQKVYAKILRDHNRGLEAHDLEQNVDKELSEYMLGS